MYCRNGIKQANIRPGKEQPHHADVKIKLTIKIDKLDRLIVGYFSDQ